MKYFCVNKTDDGEYGMGETPELAYANLINECATLSFKDLNWYELKPITIGFAIGTINQSIPKKTTAKKVKQ